MKPLTIEQLKALEVGDWVWIVCCIAGTYATKINQNEKYLEYQTITGKSYLNYSDYGTKWLAWKNKEQAEAKGEIVELPCKLQTDVVFIDISDGELNAKLVKDYLIHHYEIRGYGAIAVLYNPYTSETYEEAVSHLGLWWFTDENAAEARLAELRGEK